ncbi:MAG: diguanylate cyclase [Syntrophobacteria bacterium]
MHDESGTPHFILSVDDDPEIRELLHEVITTHLGHWSSTAVDGVDALEELTKKHYDIVIADLSMPRMDGLELIKQIKDQFDDVDVIAVTAYQTKYKYTDVIAVGANDFICKPLNLNELEAKINRITRERRLRDELKRLSIRDGLTGLYNRRYFDENLRREAGRAVRQHYGLFLLLIDIDHFKRYNDKFGHQQGDKVLKELARIMNYYSRNNVDSVYRYGGDEFAVIIPHANHEQAMMVAERLRNKFNESDPGFTSLSIGVAKLEGNIKTLEKDLESLLGAADRFLYLAKQRGGDQICTADENAHLTDSPLSTPSSRPMV